MRVAVLGAGIQGTCIALELAARGVEVDLYDRLPDALLGASGNNEGKIHVGYLYANDPFSRTAQTMVEGALNFAPLLRRWIGDAVDRLSVSSPFIYLVHRESQVAPAAFAAHLGDVADACRQRIAGGSCDYFGMDLRQTPAPVRNLAAAGISDERVAAAFSTPEISIDPLELGDVLRARLDSEPRIARRWSHEIVAVTRALDKFDVSSVHDGRQQSERYAHVVNALWESRLGIDESLGLRPNRPWLHRYKEALRLRCDGGGAIAPSITIVLGAYGDIVQYDGAKMYLSWYPVGLRTASGAVTPPLVQPLLEARDADFVKAETVAQLAAFIPALAQLPPAAIESAALRGGWIFAWGRTDVDDPQSQLHQRFAIGPLHEGNYISVDTGRFVTAPLFALRVADAIRPLT